MSNKNTLEKQGKNWLQARDIIAQALADMIGMGLCRATCRDRENASAIIACLAKEGLLICTADEMKP